MKKRVIAFGILAVGLLVLAAIFIFPNVHQKEKPSIISKATLEKVINVSNLSTFESVYNGVAKVMNQKDPQEIDYYVSYEAKVKTGIDFEKVQIEIDEENKMISVKLPKVKITEVEVAMESLDYIFINDNANTSTISAEAYKRCIEDATMESNKESAIYELAAENARSVIEALIKPFVESLDSEYRLDIH